MELITREDIMVDIETLGTKPGCIVLTVGAALFVPQTGEVKSTFYERIAFEDSVLRGLVVEPDTYAWWQKQDEEARKEAFSGEKNLSEVALAFEQWVRSHKGVQDFWCQGTDFDYPIWEAAFKRGSIANFPVKFYQKRDTRTVYSVAGFDPAMLTREGTYHNALDDTLHQIRCVHECYRRLGMAATPTTPASDLDEEEIEL